VDPGAAKILAAAELFRWTAGVDRGPLIHLDTSRIRSLGWQPKRNIRQAVEFTVDWLDMRIAGGLRGVNKREGSDPIVIDACARHGWHGQTYQCNLVGHGLFRHLALGAHEIFFHLDARFWMSEDRGLQSSRLTALGGGSSERTFLR
jgi:hypothetical protein